MEGFSEKRGPGLDRIVGVEPLEEDVLRLEHELSVLRDEIPSKFEREATVDEESIILEILPRLTEFVKEYGAEKAANVFLNQIHFIDSSNPDIHALDSHWEPGVQGRFNIVGGQVEILADPNNILKTAHTLVHELIHANAFRSITVFPSEEDDSDPSSDNRSVAVRRGGLSVRQRGTETNPPGEYFFDTIDEAVTEELARRFCERYFEKIPLLKEKFQKKTRFTNPLLNLMEEVKESNPTYHYLAERIDLSILINILYQKNRDKFDSHEEVFKLFSTAAFTGRLLPVARLIEKTLGKDMFKKIGEATKERNGDFFSILRDFAEQEGIVEPQES